MVLIQIKWLHAWEQSSEQRTGCPWGGPREDTLENVVRKKKVLFKMKADNIKLLPSQFHSWKEINAVINLLVFKKMHVLNDLRCYPADQISG